MSKTKTCAYCGEIFHPPNSLQKYCSRDCYYKSRKKENSHKKKMYICGACGKKFTGWAYRNPKYCSKQCKLHHKTTTRLCAVCGKEFDLPECRTSGKSIIVTCSKLCSIQYRKLKKPKKGKIKKSTVDAAWSSLIRARAGNRCEYCGSPNNPNAHHVITRRNMATRWDLDNGVCLCAKHHTFDMFFSAHQNPLEFIDWKKKDRGKEWHEELRKKSRSTERVDQTERYYELKELMKLELKGLT